MTELNQDEVPETVYDSGVTNGDVDWLFRGKSKKLTKKMNLNNIDSKLKIPNEDRDKVVNDALDGLDDDKDNAKHKHASKAEESSKETSSLGPTSAEKPLPQEAGNSANTSDDKIKVSRSPDTAKLTSHRSSDTKTSKDKTLQPERPTEKSEKQCEKTTPTKPEEDKKPSKLDKFLGRTRSNSNSNSNPASKSPSEKSKKSMNLLNYSGTSFDGASMYNHGFDHNYYDMGLNSNPQPKQRSRSGSVSSTSSTGSQKKSLLGSFSSKFKSNPPPANSSPVNTSMPNSPTNSLSPNVSQKGSSVASPQNIPNSTFNNNSNNSKNPNENVLISGVSGAVNPDDSWSSFYHKPPAELSGIPIKRRNSVQSDSNSANSSFDNKLSGPGFNTLFKRRPSTSSHHSTTSTNSAATVNNQRVVLNKNPKKEILPLKELNDVDLKRVNFAIDKLIYDPQQQIPSRRPKKGNVLIPEDIIANPPRLAQGISLNDGGSGTNGNNSNKSDQKYSDKELNLAIEAQRRALIEADKHAQEAHFSARRIAHEVNQYKLKQKSKPITEENEEDKNDEFVENNLELENNEEIDSDAKVSSNIEIDKPLHLHEKHFEGDTKNESLSDLSLEGIYTRCCHLREILPIPATLKQLKNKTKPLQVLKLLNPKPTLIDVLSFSDFIAIVPVTTVIFDNVTMTTEMLKHILASLSYNKSLEKLSLRNVPIDETGWKYLCKFLSRNLSVKKLDISQQRIKSDTKPNLIRSSMNWKLFIKSLVVRGGMEELVINGCKLSDEIFKELINEAVSITTYRLGIASCELNSFKTKVVCLWLQDPSSKCVGVDVAFNDLSRGQLRHFIETFNSGNMKLIFFSLYQTNLSDIDETAELLKSLTKVKTLRFLDMSSLPNLFPSIIPKLNTYLPQMESLKRIHFDLNDLTSQSLIAIAEILPRLSGILHVSFLGNKNLDSSVAASIYSAVKKSTSLFTLDLDYDLINDKLSQRIAFYLMRNMDNMVNLNPKNDGLHVNTDSNDHQEELLFDGSLLMETAEKLLAENEFKENKIEDLKLQKIITNALIERTREVREGIHDTIDNLFSQRNSGTLSLDGKESLIRFCLLDASLEKLVHIFEEQHSKTSSIRVSPSPSVENMNSESRGTSFGDKFKNHPIMHLDKDLLHQSSTELISTGPILSPRNTETLNKLGYHQNNEQSTFQPHQVVVDSSSDGKSVPIDHLTGRPVLMRSISQTSSHAKEQEQEEGELHRWGFFMQQRNNSNSDLKNATNDSLNGKHDEIQSDSSKGSGSSQQSSSKPLELPALNVLPSGSELRDAIMEAKGIESITDLIDKINNHRVSIEKIYNIADKHSREVLLKHFNKMNLDNDGKKDTKETDNDQNLNNLKNCSDCKCKQDLEGNDKKDNDDDGNVSIDSLDNDVDEKNNSCHHVHAVVDEVYDKLLNDAQRVRSNK